MKPIFLFYSGIGNQVMRYPMWAHFGFPDIILPYIQPHDSAERFSFITSLAKRHRSKIFHSPNYEWPSPSDYDTLICPTRSSFTHVEGLRHIVCPVNFREGNEVDNNCLITGHTIQDLCLEHMPIKWTSKKKTPAYDVVICNGSVPDFSTWIRKRYNRYNEVIEALIAAGYTVCSVGCTDEYVYPAVNQTEPNLLETIDIIAKAKLFIGNDTGLWHVANAIGKKNIGIFTCTDPERYYNHWFHAEAVVIVSDFECAEMFKGRMGVGNYCERCDDWECTFFPPDKITEIALDRLK
jgi:hypothetical protein